jgi:hypothetical protein
MSMWFHPSIRVLGFPRKRIITGYNCICMKSVSTALARLNPIESSDSTTDDEYITASSSTSNTTSACSSISGYTTNHNKNNTSLAEVDSIRVVQILSTLRKDPNTALSFFAQLKEHGFRHNVSHVCSPYQDFMLLGFG